MVQSLNFLHKSIFLRFWAFLGVTPRLQIFEITFLTVPKSQFSALAIIIDLHYPLSFCTPQRTISAEQFLSAEQILEKVKIKIRGQKECQTKEKE